MTAPKALRGLSTAALAVTAVMPVLRVWPGPVPAVCLVRVLTVVPVVLAVMESLLSQRG